VVRGAAFGSNDGGVSPLNSRPSEYIHFWLFFDALTISGANFEEFQNARVSNLIDAFERPGALGRGDSHARSCRPMSRIFKLFPRGAVYSLNRARLFWS
jgi:hypothetical protein